MLTVLGVIVGLAFLIVAIYKGVNPVLSAILSCFIVIVTSGASFQTSFDEAVASVGNIVTAIGPVIVIGGMMGAIYNASGVCLSMGKFFTRPCHKIKNSYLRKVTAILMFLLVRIVIGISGVDANALLLTTIGLALAIFAEFDIPTRLIPTLVVLVSTVNNMMPGVPHTYNLLAENYIEGFTARGAMGFRFAILAIYFVVTLVIFAVIVKKDEEKGLHFTQGVMAIPDANSMKLPPWYFGIIPVVVIFTLYNWCGFEAWAAAMVGLALTFVLLAPYIPREENETKFKSIMKTVDFGAFSYPLQLLFIILPTMAMTQTGGLDIITDGLSAVNMPAILTLVIVALVVLGFGGSNCMPVIGGMMTMFTVAGFTGLGVGCTALWASTVFDTLPNSNFLIFANQQCGTEMKDSYPPTFVTTVILTFVMTVIMALSTVIGIV